MKITKSQLKEIVKECLVEILQEGAGVSRQPNKQVTENRQTLPRSTSKDSIVFGRRNQQPKINESIIKNAAGSDPIMMGIFADTAATTLPKMLSSEAGRTPIMESRGVAESMVATTTPEDLFGEEMTNKWSALAFSAGPLKNQ